MPNFRNASHGRASDSQIDCLITLLMSKSHAGFARQMDGVSRVADFERFRNTERKTHWRTHQRLVRVQISPGISIENSSCVQRTVQNEFRGNGFSECDLKISG